MILRICLAVALVMAVIIGAMSARAESYGGHPVVVDGDTLKIGQYRIRMHGIDAPEMRQLCYEFGQPIACGRLSRDALADLIADNIVLCRKQTIGKYGRIIGKCFVGEHDLQSAMVRAGWATAYERYSADYVQEQAYAKERFLGIWGWAFVSPEEWRRANR